MNGGRVEDKDLDSVSNGSNSSMKNSNNPDPTQKHHDSSNSQLIKPPSLVRKLKFNKDK
jgi:hypothetical protein